jgi:hypothetical protein
MKPSVTAALPVGTGVSYMENLTFRATGLTSIAISASVEMTCESGFRSCGSLTSVAFVPEAKLSRMGRQTFHRMSSTSIRIPASIEVIGKFGFSLYGDVMSITFAAGSKLSPGERSFC